MSASCLGVEPARHRSGEPVAHPRIDQADNLAGLIVDDLAVRRHAPVEIGVLAADLIVERQVPPEAAVRLRRLLPIAAKIRALELHRRGRRCRSASRSSSSRRRRRATSRRPCPGKRQARRIRVRLGREQLVEDAEHRRSSRAPLRVGALIGGGGFECNRAHAARPGVEARPEHSRISIKSHRRFPLCVARLASCEIPSRRLSCCSAASCWSSSERTADRARGDRGFEQEDGEARADGQHRAMNSSAIAVPKMGADKVGREQQDDDQAGQHGRGHRQGGRPVDQRHPPVENLQVRDPAVVLGAAAGEQQRLDVARAVDNPRQPRARTIRNAPMPLSRNTGASASRTISPTVLTERSGELSNIAG